MSQIKVQIDADELKLRDLRALETGQGLYDLIERVAVEVQIDGVVIPTDDLPMSALSDIARAIGESIKALSSPNA